MGRKKLLVTASTFPRWDQDTEPRFVLDLCKAMSEYYDITVLVPASPGAADTEVLEGIKVIRYHYCPIHRFETLCYPGAIVPRIKEKKIRALLVPFLFIGLYRAMNQLIDDYDMVHAHWLIPQGIVASMFHKRKPYIVTGHGGDVCSLNKGIVRKLKIKCLRRAAHVTCVSDYLKQRILELAPGTEVSVISMGVDTEAFGPQYRIENYFNQGDKKVVLFVGRLAEKKGVKYLIEAMRYVDAKLVIVGDGPLKSELMEQAEEVNTESPKICFLGSKTHDELKAIYASADIFVMSSITAKDGDQEGFGLVMLEAMASRLPVVASNSGGISQLITDGSNGLLCEEKNVWQLADNISTLLNDSTLYMKLCENGLKTAKGYSYKNQALLFKNIINQELGPF